MTPAPSSLPSAPVRPLGLTARCQPPAPVSHRAPVRSAAERVGAAFKLLVLALALAGALAGAVGGAVAGLWWAAQHAGAR